MGAAMWGCVRLGLLFALVGVALVGSTGANASPGRTVRVSVDSAGVQGGGDSGAWGRPAVSTSGRYVAFESFATNLVSDDTNSASDIFVRDRDTDWDGIFDEAGAVGTTRVSVSSGGGQANGFSFQPAISSDGRYVAFDSGASDLVESDTKSCGTPPLTYNCSDVFVHDRQTGATTRVSVSSAGAESDGDSYLPAISSDGRYVAFYSEGANLVAGDGNGADDVFVRDRDTDGDGIFDEPGAVATTRVSVTSGGSEGNRASSDPAMSSDGRFVAFYSESTNLVSGDTNGSGDIFVRDRQAGTTTRMSVSNTGVQGNGGSYGPAVSWDGRYVAFYSAATSLVSGDTNGALDVFLRDRQLGVTTRVSVDSAGDQGNGASSAPAISADGRYVAFYSEATDLVSGDTNGSCQTDPDPELDNCPDIFVRDRLTSTTERANVDSAGGQAEGGISTAPGVSVDARFVAFYSRATNLVLGDTNGRQDVFVHDRLAPVGGVAELPDVSRPSSANYTPLAGLAAAALALLAAGVWYTGRRLKRG